MKKYTKTKLTALLIISAIGIFGIWSYKWDINMIEPKYNIDEIRAGIKPLGQTSTSDLPETSRYYLDFYGLNPEKNIPGVEHLLGSFKSQGLTIAAHIFRPAEYTATVVLVHGYLNHCGQLNNIIPFLLENGYAVCTYDQPGHGLSTSKSAWADDFEIYAKAMDDFKKQVADNCTGPYHVIAFSQGSCPVIQRKLEGKETFFEKTILVAPLVRPVQWKKTQATYRFYMFFKDDVKRIPRINTNNPEFVKFNKTMDFLHSKRVPLIWVQSLEKWNRHIRALPACNEKVMIIQGDNDTTVNWKYNTKLLAEKFDAELKMIEGAKHELYNETDQYKTEVFAEIKKYLKM